MIMKIYIRIFLIALVGFCCFNVSFLAAQGTKTKNNSIVPTEDIKAHLLKKRSVKENPKVTDLELRLAISFHLNSADLTQRTKEQLDNLAAVLVAPEFTNQKIELAGHTCELGDATYNLALSQKRVKGVVNYLVKTHHINPQRITNQAYGESMPLIPAARNEKERAVNRRVVVYRPEDRPTIERMLREMPKILGFSWAALHYTKDNKTKLIEYDGSSSLESGGEYRLLLRPATKKWVYIYQKDSRGNHSWLFPRNDVGLSNPMQPGEYFLPSKSEVFVLDENTGTETIYLVATEEPAEELEALLNSESPELFTQALSKTVKLRGLKDIRIGKPANTKNVPPHVIYISKSNQAPQKKQGGLRLGTPQDEIANIMATYREFMMMLSFEHK